MKKDGNSSNVSAGRKDLHFRGIPESGGKGYRSGVRRKKQMGRGWSIGQERTRKIVEQITYRPKPAGSACNGRGYFPPFPLQAPTRFCSYKHRSVPLHTNSSTLLLGNNVYHPLPPSAYLLPNSSKGKRPTGNTTTSPSSPSTTTAR